MMKFVFALLIIVSEYFFIDFLFIFQIITPYSIPTLHRNSLIIQFKENHMIYISVRLFALYFLTHLCPFFHALIVHLLHQKCFHVFELRSYIFKHLILIGLCFWLLLNELKFLLQIYFFQTIQGAQKIQPFLSI